MRQQKYFERFGATCACTLRMAEEVKSNGQEDEPLFQDILYADSWFSSVMTAKQIVTKFGMQYCGIVKT